MSAQPVSIFELAQFMQLHFPIYTFSNRYSVENGKVCNDKIILLVFYDDKFFYVLYDHTVLYSIEKSDYQDQPIAKLLDRLLDIPTISSILTEWSFDSFNSHSDEPVTPSGYPAGGYFDYNWNIEPCQQLGEPDFNKDDFDTKRILLNEFPLYSGEFVFHYHLYKDEEVFSPKLKL